jgi:biotin transport system substrate-specific component
MSALNISPTLDSASGGNTLFDAVLPTAGDRSRLVRNGAAVIVGSLLLTASAKLAIPFWPVPVTLQTLVVLCLGMVLGPKLGAAAVIAYLAQGAAGLPVFAGTPEKGIGIAYMVGPTGGYLLGFVVAAYVVGWLAERRWDRHVVGTVAAMVIGNVLIYSFGLAWLGQVVGWDKPVLDFGLKPFILGDLAKIVIAAALLPTLWRLFGKR